MNLKKPVLGIFSVGVAAVLVAPHFIGQQAEQDINALVAAVNNNPVHQLELKSYQRGWFSSKAVFEHSMQMADFDQSGGTKMTEVRSGEVVLDLQHGPVLTDYDAGLGLLSWQLQAADERLRANLTWNDGEPLYQMIGSMNLVGSGQYHDRIAGLVYRDAASDMTIELNDYRGNGEFGAEQFAYQGTNKRFRVDIADESVQIDDLTFATEAKGTLVEALTSQLLESEVVLNIAKASTPAFSMRDVQLDAKSELSDNGETLDISFVTNINNITSATGDWNNLALAMEMRRVDVAFMQAYQETVNDAYSADVEEMQEQLQALMKEHLEPVVAADPEFIISELSGQAPDGQFDGELSVKLAENAAAEMVNASGDYWLKQLLAEGYMQMDKALLRNAFIMQLETALAAQMPNQDMQSEQIQSMLNQQAEQVIGVYLQQGFIEEQEQQYRSAIELQNGVLLLNGNSIPLI
jgi:uncharacterized protein YdgA (DUF945 family)